MRQTSSILFTSLTIVLMLLFAFLFYVKLKLHWMIAVLGALNVTLFVLYVIDKLLSKSSLSRVPESLLHLLTLLGATPAAYAAQKLLRHKIMKESFRQKFYIIVGFQIILFALAAGLIIYWA